MYPVLFQLAAKPVFVGLVVASAAVLARQLLRGRRGRRPLARLTFTPLVLLAAAWLVMALRGGAWWPSLAAVRDPWPPVPIYAFGAALSVALIAGWLLVMRDARPEGLPLDFVGFAYLCSAVGGVIGARRLYLAQGARDLGHPAEWLLPIRGGAVGYGGLVAGALVGAWCCRRRNVSFLAWADLAAPVVALGTAVARVGCLLYGCDHGSRTAVPWAVRFPRESPAWRDHVQNLGLSPEAGWSLPVHPTQIYEVVLGLALFGGLRVARRHQRFSGQIFLLWVVGYGVCRAVIEALRGDLDRGYLGPLAISQVVGMASVVAAALAYARLARRALASEPAASRWEPRGAGGINAPLDLDSERRDLR